jgi:hypothetical protein
MGSDIVDNCQNSPYRGFFEALLCTIYRQLDLNRLYLIYLGMLLLK